MFFLIYDLYFVLLCFGVCGRDEAKGVVSEYLNLFNLKLTPNLTSTEDKKVNDAVTTGAHTLTTSDNKTDDATGSIMRNNNYGIDGKLNETGVSIVNKHFKLIEKAYKAFLINDLQYLQSQGENIFWAILQYLEIDLSFINETNKFACHESGIFTSKFITFALHQLEFENRDSRLSSVFLCFLLSLTLFGQ